MPHEFAQSWNSCKLACLYYFFSPSETNEFVRLISSCSSKRTWRQLGHADIWRTNSCTCECITTIFNLLSRHITFTQYFFIIVNTPNNQPRASASKLVDVVIISIGQEAPRASITMTNLDIGLNNKIVVTQGVIFKFQIHVSRHFHVYSPEFVYTL